jgi:hypothetical protein
MSRLGLNGRRTTGGLLRLDHGKPACSGIARRAIRPSGRHRRLVALNFVAKETKEADHRPITPSIWGISINSLIISVISAEFLDWSTALRECALLVCTPSLLTGVEIPKCG